jgi:hypothetical protein
MHKYTIIDEEDSRQEVLEDERSLKKVSFLQSFNCKLHNIYFMFDFYLEVDIKSRLKLLKKKQLMSTKYLQIESAHQPAVASYGYPPPRLIFERIINGQQAPPQMLWTYIKERFSGSHCNYQQCQHVPSYLL